MYTSLSILTHKSMSSHPTALSWVHCQYTAVTLPPNYSTQSNTAFQQTIAWVSTQPCGTFSSSGLPFSLKSPFFALLGSLEANQTSGSLTCLSQDPFVQMEILNEFPTYKGTGEDGYQRGFNCVYNVLIPYQKDILVDFLHN